MPTNYSPLSPKPSRVLFIDEQYLKETTMINENVDPKVLIPAIKVAQDKHILLLCGSGIFEELKTQISTNTVSSDNQKLLDEYIQPCLAWWALCESLPNIVFRVQNKGIEVKNSENSEAISDEALAMLTAKYEETAKYYAKLLINFLVRYQDRYPLYYNPGGSYGSQIDSFYGIGTEYFSGLVIPQSSVNTGNSSITGLGLGIDVVFTPRGN